MICFYVIVIVDDYQASSITSPVTIPAGAMEVCIHVEIVNDTIYEIDEVFTISAQIQGISNASATVEVTIQDNEGEGI